jgi:basic membrane lipoprotein Med (substrate-binding protein (PBP1-ABC) superfamily)
MRRVSALLAAGCALCTVVLGGCWNGRALYSFEPPFLSSLGDENTLRFSLARASLVHGYLPHFAFDAGVDPVAALQGAAGRFAVVIVGPLASFQWPQLAGSFPGTRFILVDAPPPAGGAPKNTVFLTFDRTEAFRGAGRAAAEAVRSTARAGEPVSSLGARIGVLAAERSGLLPGEAEAFAVGAAEVLGGARPAGRTLAASPDPEAVRAAVNQMRSEGVTVFLLGLGERDPVGLEALREGGGAAVVSDWQESGALPAQVLASVEEDVPGGIRAALAAVRSGIPVVSGPVRLVRGRKI